MNASGDLFTTAANGERLPVAAIPVLGYPDFADSVVSLVESGQRICALFGADTGRAGVTALYAVLADDARSRLCIGSTEVSGDGFPSITPRCPQAHLFEREIAEQFGLRPEGHPWFRPVRYCRSMTGADAWGRAAGSIVPGVGDFYRVDGDQVHEVSVGPVHAGIIEPGHFRFQCRGETVMHLEIALGYQHRGVEEALIGGPFPLSAHHAETVAGDTTVGHATAYSHILESLSLSKVPARAQVIRGVALELERVANHVGDLGALSGDVGFLPIASFCGRIRGDFLNLTAALCGNRFGRGLVRPGGTGFDPSREDLEGIRLRLRTLKREVTAAVELLWNNQTVMARFEETGRVTRDRAVELGLVGPAARACGLLRDARYSHPSGLYRFAQPNVCTYDTGDVFARAYVRWLEIQESIDFMDAQLGEMPGGPARLPAGKPEADSISVALTEGWRGEICHAAITDARGAFRRYKIVDPSFHNWHGLACALVEQEISDFPICNKSFNLSYCGHDL